MNCQDARAELRDAFDGGRPPEAGAAQHCEACPDCAAYAACLARLDGDIKGLDLGPAPQGLAARMAESVLREERRTSLSLAQVAAGLLAAACALVILGALVPSQWGFNALLDRAEAWRPELTVQGLRAALLDAGGAAGNAVRAYQELAGNLIRTPLWLLALAGLALLIAYNALEAALLRRRTHGPRRAQA